MNKLVEHFNKTFLKGLLIVIPVAVTVFICVWIVKTLEETLGAGIKEIAPLDLYFPGMGVVFGIALFYLIGLLARAWLVRNILGWGERLLQQLPFVKNIYSAIREIANLFDSDKDGESGRVVLVPVGDMGFSLIGFITQSDSEKIPAEITSNGKHKRVAVYLPMSYQLGGYTVFVDPKILTSVDMSVDKASQYVLTAGVSSEQK
jgi:uncharacterized membrane protein